MPLTVRPITAVAGAEVTGVDLAGPLDDKDFDALRKAWLEHNGVLVVRDQKLSPEQHLEFSRRFGPLFGEAEQLQDTVKKYLLPGHPGIYRVSNKVEDGKPLGRARAGTYWHSDVSFRARPAMASILYAIEIPPVGGDTLFANMYAAWDGLSPALKDRLRGLSAVHDFAVAAPVSYTPDVIERGDFDGRNRYRHPVVITHPETGRRALFVNPGFTSHLDGFDKAESDALLGFLYRHATRPEFVYRHRWRPRDLLIWDNRCLMHYAVADYEADRHLHRTTVIADPPTR
ncbi:MAG: TauD/TfdA family dioxygenase [Gammaproteobacteria bacterium]|nr:TauD/TfdA family dioxygenase [Gammaproteobacteria bacterium]